MRPKDFIQAVFREYASTICAVPGVIGACVSKNKDNINVYYRDITPEIVKIPCNVYKYAIILKQIE